MCAVRHAGLSDAAGLLPRYAVSTRYTTDKLFKRPGVVSYRPTMGGEFRRSEPKKLLGAFYQECNYTPDRGEVVLDYLEEL